MKNFVITAKFDDFQFLGCVFSFALKNQSQKAGYLKLTQMCKLSLGKLFNKIRKLIFSMLISPACLFKLGMNSGLIPDNMITATSIKNGKSPQDARAPVDTSEYMQMLKSSAVCLIVISACFSWNNKE